MIPYEVDPSLYSDKPEQPLLDDGFSPPDMHSMSTHPVEPEPLPPSPEPVAPNPTHLPIEPEFGPQWPPSEPEDPHAKPPTL